MRITPLQYLIARRHGSPAVRRLVRKLEKFCHSSYNGGRFRCFEESGEAWLIDRLCAYWQGREVRPVAWDVGANVGVWAYTLLQGAPHAQVHCFEPVPSTFRTLDANLKNTGDVRLNPFGLSDSAGPMELWENDAGADTEPLFRRWTSLNLSPGKVWLDAASRFRMDDRPERKIQVRMERGADYARDHNIPRIHALKVDAEGMDYQALAGMAELISEQRIDLIQHEWVEHGSIDSPEFKDYLRLLTGQYEVGRIYPKTIKFRDWRKAWSREAIAESRCDGNYVAVARSRPELLAHLQAEGR